MSTFTKFFVSLLIFILTTIALFLGYVIVQANNNREVIENISIQEPHPGQTESKESTIDLNGAYAFSIMNDSSLLTQFDFEEHLESNPDILYITRFYSQIGNNLNREKDFQLSGDTQKLIYKLRQELSSMQASTYPIIRQEFAKNAAEEMKEYNVDIIAIGEDNAYLCISGEIFTTKDMVKETQNLINESAIQLRFKQVRYKADSNSNKYILFTLNTPEDGDIL